MVETKKFPPREPQIKYITGCLTVFEKSSKSSNVLILRPSVGILQGDCGTGKTYSYISSALHFIKKKERKLYILSRTHK